MITFAVLGAGDRGNAYARWIAVNSDVAKVVAVAEPREHQRAALARRHDIPPERVFSTWQELVQVPKLADAAIVATKDTEHVAPSISLAHKGYHLLVEKPLAPTEEECRTLVGAVVEAGVLFAVCHVLRYRPYTTLLKHVVDSGRIGAVQSVQHLEPVGYWHYAHAFVRGNWRRSDEASFMLLAKSCHDIDWLRHVIGRPIERVSSFGSLTHFTPANKPAGSADRCLDCAVESNCAYSSTRLYLGMVGRGSTGWPVSVLVDEVTEESVRQALRDGPYGRCVYSSDNDVVDHQVVSMEFAGGTTATFQMVGFSAHMDRRTQIFGTRGTIDGDGETLSIYDFTTGQTEQLTAASLGMDAGTGRGGGDAGLMKAFTTAVATGDPSPILSGPRESLETHLAVFAAERARHRGTVESVS